MRGGQGKRKGDLRCGRREVRGQEEGERGREEGEEGRGRRGEEKREGGKRRKNFRARGARHSEKGGGRQGAGGGKGRERGHAYPLLTPSYMNPSATEFYYYIKQNSHVSDSHTTWGFSGAFCP